MERGMVKRILAGSNIFVGLALLTAVLSATGLLPQRVVEHGYSRPVFPLISRLSAAAANAVPFSLMDAAIVMLVLIVALLVLFRRWRWLAGATAAAYLLFFWGWAVNYHRESIEEKLALNAGVVSDNEAEQFREFVASKMNSLWPQTASSQREIAEISRSAAERVRTVISRIDAVDWAAARQTKKIGRAHV